jgi:hypothetical protein
MDFDVSQKAVPGRKKTGGKLLVVIPEVMGNSVHPESMQTGITKKHLGSASGGRVIILNSFDIFSHGLEH